MNKEEYKLLETLTAKYLDLMKQGKFNDACLVTRSLESATYLNDPIWVEADKKKRRRN